MLSIFLFDLCSSGEILVYREVPEVFGNHKQVPRTSSLSSSSSRTWVPALLACRRQCFAPAAALPPPMAPPPAGLPSHASSPPGPDLFPLPWWSLARAPRHPRTLAGRHLHVAVESSPQRLNSRSLTRNSITLTPTSCSSSPSANFRAPEPHSSAAVSSCSGHARHARGQPAPDPLRSN
jgi:hypothetical protein